ncbi:hypothetical protein SFC66_02335 [Terribacillus saccharophilus]|uniref:hypothetical protein n=1 Tax=Terribacillus saccharophilus TaxID=361277 RepID=UPI00398219CC
MSALIVVPLYLIAIFLVISSSRSKDSKGAAVRYRAMSYAIVVFPIGWLIMEAYRHLIQPVPLETYRGFMTMLLPIIFIVYGFSLFLLRRRMSDPEAADH